MQQAEQLFQIFVKLAKNEGHSRAKYVRQLSAAPSAVQDDVIKRAVQSRDAQLRRTAYAVIGEWGNLRFADHLCHGLDDAKASVVQMAVWAVGKCKWHKALPKLTGLIRRKFGFKVIKTIIWTLGELKDIEVTPILCDLLIDANVRQVEGILVSGLKLGYTSFREIILALDCQYHSVQTALRNMTQSNQKMRAVLLRMAKNEKDQEVTQALVQILPYTTFYEHEYHQLLQQTYEPLRLAVFHSIGTSALPIAIKKAFLLNSLNDPSNRLVLQSLEQLKTMLTDSIVRKQFQNVATTHLSPKIRHQAQAYLRHADQLQQLKQQKIDQGHFLLETLPGLESFVQEEAILKKIPFNVKTMGNGWLEIEWETTVSLDELRKLHTISRICGIDKVWRKHENIESLKEAINPFERITIDGQVFEVITLFQEKQMLRPRRTLHATSLDWRVARAMVLISKPTPRDVVVDPTCGSGTLLMDRAAFGLYERLLGGDQDESSVCLAKQNLRPFHDVTIQQWDARSISIDEQCVSTILANLPFGRRVGDHEANLRLYPQLVKEIVRLLQVGGRAVLLTQESKLMHDVLKPYLQQLMIELDHKVEMGGLTPHIFCLRRIDG
ncbi:HEAT repeat-containing protein [Seinonella peptonophila]|uniref:HEAT repeat-containing protein n=1 Tax=Seinonella peptonophila TaxID=112248 RepID=A0A1M4WDM9_9BACL|nr:HEAT repeat domain-containing protein [Seinonella peptonophila]SHE79391.1 HEAT repeat-containing protein [Seinonella peptonophila]